MAPKVPVLREAVGPVTPSAVPGARVSTDAPISAFGGGQETQRVARQGRELLKQSSQIIQQEKKRADDVFETMSYTGVVNAKNALLKEFKTLQGKDAIDSVEDFGKRFEDEANKIQKQQNNEEQQAFLTKIRAQQRGQFDVSVGGHVRQQSLVLADKTFKAGIETAQANAEEDYKNEKVVAQNITDQISLIQKSAELKGETPEIRAARIDAAISKTRTRVIDRHLANGEDKEAKEYFSQVKGQIQGPDLIRIEKNLHEGSVRGESQRIADSIMAKNLGRKESLVLARETTDDETRDATVRRVNARFSERESIKVANQKQNYLDVVNRLEDRPNEPEPRYVATPAEWTSLTGEQKTAIRKRHGDRPNDDKAWNEFSVMLSETEMAELDPVTFDTRYWSKFDNAHRERATKEWKAAQKALGKDPKLTAIFTSKKLVLDAFKSTGLVPSKRKLSKYTPTQNRMLKEFNDEAVQRLFEFETSKKRKADPLEKQKIFNQLGAKVFISSSPSLFSRSVDLSSRLVFGFPTIGDDTEKAVFLLNEEESDRAYVPIKNVPKVYVDRLIEKAKLFGVVATNEMIERAYAAVLVDDDERAITILKGEE